MHRPIPATLLTITLLAPAFAVAAEPVYKSVDEQGNVTYSAEPPADAVQSEQIAVPPPPTEEEVKRAEDATRQLQEQAGKMEQERKAREAEQAAAARAAEPSSGGTTLVVPLVDPGYVDDPTRIPLRPALPAGPGRPKPTPLPSRPPMRR